MNYYFVDFSAKGGGVPPKYATYFHAKYISAKGGEGYPPILFYQKKRVLFGPKILLLTLLSLVLASFGPFSNIFGPFFTFDA